MDSFTIADVEADVTDPVGPSVVAPTKTRVVIVHDDARRILRGMQAAALAGIGFVPVCMACREAGKPELSIWGRHRVTGEMTLECTEHVRILEGLRK